MRQFLVSAGRIFNRRGFYASRIGMQPNINNTATQTKDHPVKESKTKMSDWEHTKEKISNKGKAGFGSDTKPVEMPIVERARVKGADRQASQHQRMDQATGNASQKASLQSDMDAGVGINQSDAAASKSWTASAKDQTRDLGNLGKKRSKEQLMRDAASGGMNQGSDMLKEMQDLAEKERRADERAAKYPNMPKQEEFKRMEPPKEHAQTEKITQVINEEHGIPEVGQSAPKNTSPGTTGQHEQHGARRAGDDMFKHEPKMRFDPARSYEDNVQIQPERKDIRNTADHQRMEKEEGGMFDTLKEKASAAGDWVKEKLGTEQPAQKSQTIESQKQEKTRAKQEVSEAEGKVQPQMRGDFGILSGSPIGGIKAPEKKPSREPNMEIKQ